MDFSHKEAVQLTGTKQWAETYTTNQGLLLLHMRVIVSLNIKKSLSYHHERLNDLRPDPCVYDIGDLMLARHSVLSNRTKCVVDKTEFTFTGPWTVTKKLKRTPYELTHTTPKKVTKKYTVYTNPVPQVIQGLASFDKVDS